eukprot:13259316-Ditylum_brightwellii.AAC.1
MKFVSFAHPFEVVLSVSNREQSPSPKLPSIRLIQEIMMEARCSKTLLLALNWRSDRRRVTMSALKSKYQPKIIFVLLLWPRSQVLRGMSSHLLEVVPLKIDGRNNCRAKEYMDKHVQ